MDVQRETPPMRIHALAIATVATILIANSAQAQTYNPNYPVCLEAYGDDGSVVDCGYTSLPQCAQSATGRGQCFNNPYFAGTRVPAAQGDRRPRSPQ